jgi:tRNA threonylcarbamoyladenosine biosynthesis protein TsaE
MKKISHGRKAVFKVGGKARRFLVPTAADWPSVSSEMMRLIRPGTVLAVQGDLGAGKTTFIQSLAAAFGIRRFVPSPTFALMRTYRPPKALNGIRRLVHVDAYRLKDESELQVLDLDEELADGQSFLVLEWPERVAGWLASRPNDIIHLKII